MPVKTRSHFGLKHRGSVKSRHPEVPASRSPSVPKSHGADRRRCSNVLDDAVEDQYSQGREQHDDHHDGVQHDLCGRGPQGLPNAVCLAKTTKAGGGAITP